jgi:hypothetical protein
VRKTVLAAFLTAAAAAFLFVPTAGAWTTYHLAAQRVDDDSFDNYDFGSSSVSSTNVDFPVTLLFYNNAEVDKIKNSITASYPGSTQYGRLNNSFGWFYDADGGRKSAPCPIGTSDWHYRLYADQGHGDHNWSPSLGYYVIGTTHADVNECGGGTTWFGSSEWAESQVANNARGATNWIVYGSNWNMGNPEASRWEGNHYWNNNGLATMFRLP